MTAKPLFNLSGGRTGSTLLQKFLNATGDVVMWGEHAGFLRPVARAYYHATGDENMRRVFATASGDPAAMAAAVLTEAQVSGPRQTLSWANWFTEEQYRGCFRDFVTSLFAPHPISARYWGFKEIRYGLDDKVMELLSDLFPDAGFIFLVRNPVDNIASQARALSEEDTAETRARRWARQNGNFLKFAAAHGNCHVLRFEDFIHEDRRAARALLDKLGVAYTSDHDKVLNEIVDGVPAHRRREAELGPEEIASVVAVTRAIAERLGYDLPPAG